MPRLALLIVLIAAVAGGALMWFRQSRQSPVPESAFDMPIDDAFAVNTPGRVVVVGVISSGEIKPQTQLFLTGSETTIPVTVISLEGGVNKTVSSAHAGDRVGVMLEGAGKADVLPDSHLVDAKY